MIRGLVLREADDTDRDDIRQVTRAAFSGGGEAGLVDALFANGDVVLDLVATHEGELVAHVMFSRLAVIGEGASFDAVALAPIAVLPGHQRTGIGSVLVEHAHHLLAEEGERLSVVLGDPAYYGRFGYSHERAASFASDYQCEALQALAWGPAPVSGRLVYASAFSGL